MKVSVVIPVYNAEMYVKQAVFSALDQPEVTEVLFVDAIDKWYANMVKNYAAMCPLDELEDLRSQLGICDLGLSHVIDQRNLDASPYLANLPKRFIQKRLGIARVMDAFLRNLGKITC